MGFLRNFRQTGNLFKYLRTKVSSYGVKEHFFCTPVSGVTSWLMDVYIYTSGRNTTFLYKKLAFYKKTRTLAPILIRNGKYNACYISVTGFFYAFFSENKMRHYTPVQTRNGNAVVTMRINGKGSAVLFLHYLHKQLYTGMILSKTIVIRAKYALLTTQANAKFWQTLYRATSSQYTHLHTPTAQWI